MGLASAKIPYVKVSLDEKPSFWGEYRCKDERNLFASPDTVFSNDCNTWLQEMAGVHTKGKISFLTLSDETIDFEGFKVNETAEAKTNNKPWAAYDTPMVRYGASWKG
jgi:hypothetical protein